MQLQFSEQANLSLNFATKEQGAITAMVARYGPREMNDGRKIFWTSGMFKPFVDSFNFGDRPLPMFYNHMDMEMPAGQWTRFEDAEDGAGLMGYGNIFTATSGGNDLYTILKQSPNLIGGVSIGIGGDKLNIVNADGEPVKGDEEGYWQVGGAYLREVSVVYKPADTEATIEELFYANGNMNVGLIEKKLRDAGFSRSQAKHACAVFKDLPLRDAGELIDIKIAGDPREAEHFAQVAEVLELHKLSCNLNALMSKGI